MKKLIKYQENAIYQLLNRSNILLKETGNETIIFQAPTGSGKTYMATRYIEELINDVNIDICFLWVSIGKGELHRQSYKSIKETINGITKVSIMEDEFFGSRTAIDKNEIVVVNWEKIRSKDKSTGDWKNIAMKDKETTNFVEVLRNTRSIGRKIILIIDESHYSATTDRAREIRDDVVKPELTIEMSATPVITDSDMKVVVNPSEVIEEGMIKKEIIINENIDEIEDNEFNSQELIMEMAIKKCEELKSAYESEDSLVNPLVLIQIPNADAGDDKLKFVKSYLEDKGINEVNGRLAILLNDEKVNNETENLKPLDSKVNYLIFKQAIDTGWDCPRASILVKFRETSSIVFEIQTIGRILRMPEAQHYNNEILNRGYVYTNIQSIAVKKEIYNPNIIKTLPVRRRDIYESLKLLSYYKQRINQGDIKADFYDVLADDFADYFGLDKTSEIQDYYNNIEKAKSKGIILEEFNKMDTIINNATVGTAEIDKTNTISVNNKMDVNFAENDLQHAFYKIIEENLNGFAPRRSISKVSEAIYYTFNKYFNFKRSRGGAIYIQNIIVKNREVFSMILDKAIKRFAIIRQKQIESTDFEQWNDKWEIDVTRNYNPETRIKKDSILSLYQPLYLMITQNGKPDQLEVNFIEYLDSHPDKISWFWQNGSEHMKINFGIKKEDGSTFQPDFLVKFKDGRIGIFDTKGVDQREDDNREKHNALFKYIYEQRNKGYNLIGGLVILDGNHFRINMNEEYKPYSVEPNEWVYFEEVL